MNTQDFMVVELNSSEQMRINGGGRLSWAIGYIGGVFENIYDAWASTPEGAATRNALRDFQ